MKTKLYRLKSLLPAAALLLALAAPNAYCKTKSELTVPAIVVNVLTADGYPAKGAGVGIGATAEVKELSECYRSPLGPLVCAFVCTIPIRLPMPGPSMPPAKPRDSCMSLVKHNTDWYHGQSLVTDDAGQGVSLPFRISKRRHTWGWKPRVSVRYGQMIVPFEFDSVYAGRRMLNCATLEGAVESKEVVIDGRDAIGRLASTPVTFQLKLTQAELSERLALDLAKCLDRVEKSERWNRRAWFGTWVHPDWD